MAGEDFLGLLVLGGDGTDRGGTKAMSFGSPTPSGMLKLATIRRYQNFGHFGHHGRSPSARSPTVRYVPYVKVRPPAAIRHDSIIFGPRAEGRSGRGLSLQTSLVVSFGVAVVLGGAC